MSAKANDSKGAGIRFAAVALVLLLSGVATVAAVQATLIFTAYASGRLIARWLPLSAFESTLVALIALVSAAVVVLRTASRFVASMASEGGERCAECAEREGSSDEQEAVVDFSSDEKGLRALLSPNDGLRAALFASGSIKPGAPCPCGSGRRYGRCCGDARLFRQ